MSDLNFSGVSICLPTFNRPKLIEELLDSIFKQTFQNFEIIITDNSDNLDTQYLISTKFQDNRIRYFKNEKNLGMGGSTRRALSFVQGKFFTFTPDDDIWIDSKKLEKQVNILEENPEINIVYSNAESISQEGKPLLEFGSVYPSSKESFFEIINSIELLPGQQTEYFLNILTPILRTDKLLTVFKQSWYFDSEEFFCYYLSASSQKMGFLYDKTVALREGEHHRTTVENGNIVDWKKRKDIRIRQILSIYSSLIYLYPETKMFLETTKVHNFLAKHLLSSAKASRSIFLFLKTLAACSLYFNKYSLITTLRLKIKKNKSFG
ncbi:glycosyltransferase family 2 protein [Flavobacteriaceae bacterium]|nr:glycosyltransferase family 2 protein [Flavobacteriaceae bacterium]